MSTPAVPPPRPFLPVQILHAGAGSTQRLYPAVDLNGTPTWQGGDVGVLAWPISSLGWCHGAVTNRKDNIGIEGTVYLSGARVVAVSPDVKVTLHYRRGFASLSLNRYSVTRHRRETAGTYLGAQMRLPWLTRVVWTPPDVKKSSGELRLCAEHLSSFSEPESVMLLLRLSSASETQAFVVALIDRIKKDRWEGASEETRAKLASLPVPWSTTASPGELPSVRLPGAFRVSAQTAARGALSTRSFPGEGQGSGGEARS